MTRQIGITGYGGYVPRLRLSRKSIVEANAWFNPALGSMARGERSFCNWDEDSLTMAVEAARDCLTCRDQPKPEAIYLASTTLPYADRQNSTILAGALNLGEQLHSLDVTSSQRAGTTGLITALEAVRANGSPALYVSADKRSTRAASAQELRFGDGAAAFMLGTGEVTAELVGSAQRATDFVDHFRGRKEEFDYVWEDRWIQEEGFGKIVPEVVRELLAATGVQPDAIDHLVMAAPKPSLSRRIAKEVGISENAVGDDLGAIMGECGTAHVLVMLAETLHRAKPGDLILVVGWGQGCDALMFRATDSIQKVAPTMGIEGYLARRHAETNYIRYLAFNGLIEQEHGIRSEADHSAALSALYRNRDSVLGLLGGVCKTCGTQQFPRSNVCVNPNCGDLHSQESRAFSDIPATIRSWTADILSYSPDPPSHYGMVAFDGGGQFMIDMTDVDPGTLSVGTPVRMAFRIKAHDRKRGFTRYFWKAVPQYAESGK